MYFGDDPKSDTGDGVIVPTTVTAGNTFRFDLFIENEGNQRLTHSEIGYGSLAVARSGSNPSLPAGASIVSATLNGDDCTITVDLLGALCDLGQFDAGDTATAEFIVDAPSVAVITTTYASFKVAENVPDQGANRNTFYADANLNVGATTSNANATYKVLGDDFSLSTAGNTLVKKDSMTTTVEGTAGGVGAISISEEDCAPNQCVGQIATVHVQNGEEQTPYLKWTLVLVGTFGGVITHELDNGDISLISASCSDTVTTECIETPVVKTGNVTTIVFRTETNGRVSN